MILRLFKHLFWLAAWGVWLWLGFGLYRELPRDVGPVVGKLPLEGEADHLLGILEGDDLALTMSVKPAYGGNVQFDTWEIVGRRTRHSFVGPTLWFGSNSSIRHGVAIGPARGDDKSAKESMQVLDLRTGEWKKLGPKTWNHLGVHPTRPWAAFADNGDRKSPAKLFVIDFRTGERVFEWTASSDPKRKLFLRECQFLDGDEFLINASDPRSVFIHLSRTRGELARMTIDRPRFSATGPIRNGRVALLGLVGDEGVVEVVEFPTGRTIFSSASLPAEIKAATKDDWMSPANLSTQGRGLFTWGSKLFSVDDGRLLWSLSSIDDNMPRDPPPDSFVVHERWGKLLDRFGLSMQIDTTAVRDMETGKVLHRYCGFGRLGAVSNNGRLAVDSFGTVYEMPLRVNWPLLAACQAVLASPLVLLWLLLRWRRRRIARRMSVEAAP
jgi:hypothetical protein